MVQIAVDVENSVYAGVFHGERIEVREYTGKPLVIVYEDDDGDFTAHRASHVKDITIESDE